MKPQLVLKLCAAAIGVSLLNACVTIPAKSEDHAAPSSGAIAGQLLFEKRCTGCHGLDNAKEGPPLRTVYGRRAGSVAGFQYSPALKQSHIVWDETTLNQWLTSTESLVHDNDMDFSVPQPGERAEIIQYLKQSSAK